MQGPHAKSIVTTARRQVAKSGADAIMKLQVATKTQQASASICVLRFLLGTQRISPGCVRLWGASEGAVQVPVNLLQIKGGIKVDGGWNHWERALPA